jgi:hypothetical protein
MSLIKACFLVAFAGLAITACNGGQGDTCSDDTDCGPNLTCQPIKGRTKNFCCPTPAESSSETNCHPSLPGIAAQENAPPASSAPSSSSGEAPAADAATE